jgi:pyruvate-formate lyase-activating enzyme
MSIMPCRCPCCQKAAERERDLHKIWEWGAKASPASEISELRAWILGALTYDPMTEPYKLKEWFAKCPLRTPKGVQKDE